MTQEKIYKGSRYQYETGMQLVDLVVPRQIMINLGYDTLGPEHAARGMLEHIDFLFTGLNFHLHVFLLHEPNNSALRLKVFQGSPIPEVMETIRVQLTEKEPEEKPLAPARLAKKKKKLQKPKLPKKK